MILHPANYWKVMAGLLFATLGFAVLFLAKPEIDIVVSSWFYSHQSESFMGQSWLFLSLRHVVNTTFNIIVLVLLALWAIAVWRGPLVSPVPAWYLGFPLATILLGPGLLVNVILKGHWGRARPEHIVQFGGESDFSAPFLMVNECATNCSFVSGEASSLSTLAMLIAVLFGTQVPSKNRKALLWGCAGLALYGCFIRVFMGRHFLSDTVFAVLFCAIILWCLWGLFRMATRANVVSRRIVKNPKTIIPFGKLV